MWVKNICISFVSNKLSMNKISDKELIYKSYNNHYYGFSFPSEPTLLELNELYNQILNSKFSNKIKRKLMSKIKFQLRFVQDDSNNLLDEIKEEFQFKLN